MDTGLWIVFSIAVGAALAQGFSGFGFGIVFMAIMSLLGADLERSSVLASMLALVLVAALLIQSRARMRVDWKQAGLVALGVLISMPLGYRLLLRYGEMPGCRVAFGLILMGFALQRMFRPHLKRHIHDAWAPFFGMLSGLLSGAFACGGPPVVLYLYAREEDPRRAVGTIQAVFLGGNLFRVILVLAGERGIPAEMFLRGSLLAPVVIVCAIVGFRLAQRFSLRPFLYAVYGLILLAGFVNVFKGVWMHG